MTGSELIAPKMHEGELRILDTELATRLGFKRPRDIRKTIERHLADLDRLGSRATVAREPGASTREPDEKYYLNRKQAIFITAKSETEDATDITIEIIHRFDAYERGEAPLAITGPVIQQLVTDVAALREEVRAFHDGYDGRRKRVKDFWTMAEIFRDQKVAKPWKGIGNSCRARLDRYSKSHNLHDVIRVDDGPNEPYIYKYDFVRAWLTYEGDQIIRAHNDARRGQGVLKLVDPPRKPQLKPVPRERELPPSTQGPAA